MILTSGQAGFGKKENIGKLAFGPKDNFCMGGVGVILSQKALRKRKQLLSFVKFNDLMCALI